MTNIERAKRAATVAVVYGQLGGMRDENIETVVGDLLSDFLHLATAAGIDYEGFLEVVTYSAKSHYESEAARSDTRWFVEGDNFLDAAKQVATLPRGLKEDIY